MSLRLTKLVEHSSDSGESSKWKLAVALGVPIAVVSGFVFYWYWRSKKRAKSLAGSAQSPAVEEEVTRTTEPVTSKTKEERRDAQAASASRQEETLSPLQQARELKAKGNALYKAGKYDEAVKAYEEAIQVCPASGAEDIAVFHQNIAAVYAARLTKEADEGSKAQYLNLIVDHCSKALKLNPKYVKALSRRVKAFEALGRNRECVLDFTRVALLDKTESKSLGEAVAAVIKAVGKELSDGFADLGPLSPPPYLVKSFFECFVWKDDLSDACLKNLWMSTHPVQHREPASEQPSPTASSVPGEANKEHGASGDAIATEGMATGDGVTTEGIDTADTKTTEDGASADAKATEDGASGDAKATEDGASGDAKATEDGASGDAKATEDEASGDAKATEDEASGDAKATEDEASGDAKATEDGASIEMKAKDDRPASDGKGQPQQQQAEQANRPDPMEGYAEQPFVRAVQLLRKNKFDDIIKLLTEAIDGGDPVFVPHALLLRAAMYSLWRQDQLAVVDYDAIISSPGLEPQMYSNALVNKANVLAGLQEVNQSQDCFTQALKVDPGCTDVYIHRARIVMESENQALDLVNGAVRDLETAAKLAPDHSYCHYRLAAAYHRLMGITQSMQLMETVKSKFEKAYRQFPSNAEGLVLYSMFLQDFQELDKAEEVLVEAVKLEPGSPLPHFALGLITLLFHQDVQRAQDCMETAIKADRSCVQAYETLASLELQRGNSIRAMELYDRAIKFSRTKAEMAQACIAKELISAQERARIEFGISAQELSESFARGE
eukprot:Em0006g747a